MSLALVLTMVYSCKKEVAYEDLPELPAEDKATMDTIAQTDAALGQVYTVVHTEVSNVEDQAFKTGGASGLGLPCDPNVVITKEIDSTDKANKFAKKVTLDYGHGMYGWNGFHKRGKIIIVKDGPIAKKGTKCTVTFENFYMNYFHDKLEGTVTIENQGFLNGAYTMKLDMTDGKYYTMEGTVGMEYHLSLVMTASNGTYNLAMTGTQTYNYNGSIFAQFITSPFKTSDACDYIIAGAAELTVGGNKKIIDYGSGDCDNKATVIENNKTYQHPCFRIR